MSESDFEVDTSNEYLLGTGKNLPNHSLSMIGKGKFVRQSLAEIPQFRDKQSAYRYAAWLITLADVYLPDELDVISPTWEQVLHAVQNA
jgi:hypothetical protein